MPPTPLLLTAAYQDNLQPHPWASPARSLHAATSITPALCLHPRPPPSPFLPAPAPCLPRTSHPPAFPGPWPQLPPDRLARFCLLVVFFCSLLLSRELPCGKVQFLPEKGPHGNRNVQRDEKAAAAETAGTEGAPGGGEPGDNWSLNGRGRRGPPGEWRFWRRRGRQRGVHETMEMAQ